MRLYAGTSKNFIEDTVRNQIAEKLRRAKNGMKKSCLKTNAVILGLDNLKTR